MPDRSTHEDWAYLGSCRTYPHPEIFFPERENAATNPEAKAVCRGCDVQQECLQEGLDDRDLVGIWGGTTDLERVKLRAMLGGKKLSEVRFIDEATSA